MSNAQRCGGDDGCEQRTLRRLTPITPIAIGEHVDCRAEAAAHHAALQNAADARYDEMIHAAARVHDKREARRAASSAGTCGECGTSAHDSDKFCAECGARLLCVPPPAPVPQSAARIFDPTAPSADALYDDLCPDCWANEREEIERENAPADVGTALGGRGLHHCSHGDRARLAGVGGPI